LLLLPYFTQQQKHTRSNPSCVFKYIPSQGIGECKTALIRVKSNHEHIFLVYSRQEMDNLLMSDEVLSARKPKFCHHSE